MLMERPFDYIRDITPNLVKTLYRQSRHGVRKVLRSLKKVNTCRIRGVVIRIGVSSELEQYRAETYSTKEPETLDWLDHNLEANDTFFDVGANIGLYSLYAAKIKPQCTIYAFEPAAPNYLRLCNNIVLNSVTNIIPCNFPVSDRETFDLFHVGDMQPGSAMHSFGRVSEFWEGLDVALRQGALSMSLDALVGNYGLPQPSLLKIDVDGSEERILSGAEIVLKSGKLRTILVELSFKDESDNRELEQKLASFGYKLWRKSEWTSKQKSIISQNYIFQRE